MNDEPKKGDVEYGNGFCEHCMELDEWQGAIFDGGIWWCLFCAQNGEEFDPLVLGKAIKVQEARKTIYFKAVKEMDKVTAEMLKNG